MSPFTNILLFAEKWLLKKAEEFYETFDWQHMN